jgi:hypothetical protein
LLRIDRFQELKRQAEVKHVVVDGMFINLCDLSEKEARAVFNGVEAELKQGGTWNSTLCKWTENYSEVVTNIFDDGKLTTMTITKVGNFGDFVVPANNKAEYSYRLEYLSKAHVASL